MGNLGLQYNNFVNNRENFYNLVNSENSIFTYANKDNAKDKILQLGKETHDLYDTNKDGSISSDEFIQKEMSDYKKMFKDEPMDEKTQLEIEAGLEESYKALNTDDNKGIDSKEMTAYLALIDAKGAKDPNGASLKSVDGEITYSDYAAVGAELPKSRQILLKLMNEIFPPKKPE
jgi:hypothetical protein